MIDIKVVEKVASLAKIEISGEEKRSLGVQLSKIIGYIDKLKEVQVEFVSPMRGLHAEGNIFREDESRVIFDKGAILQNAPSLEGGYFKIPKVI